MASRTTRRTGVEWCRMSSGSMYWHGRPLEDVHSEVNRVLKLPEPGSLCAAGSVGPQAAQARDSRMCADDSGAQMRRVPMPGTVSVLPSAQPAPRSRGVAARAGSCERLTCSLRIATERRRAHRLISAAPPAAPGILAQPAAAERADGCLVQQRHCA